MFAGWLNECFLAFTFSLSLSLSRPFFHFNVVCMLPTITLATSIHSHLLLPAVSDSDDVHDECRDNRPFIHLTSVSASVVNCRVLLRNSLSNGDF